MSKMSALKNNWTPVAVADTTNFTDSGYMALLGAAATQRTNISEIYMGGLAGTSAPAQMLFARDSTIGATSLTGVLTSILDPSTGALANPVVAFSASTTKPQRSATVQFLALAFNAFGGVVRWVAPPGGEIGMMGNTAALFGEVSLSHASAGTPGLMSAHIIYETM
jgi:hypothetical protein